jgi:hypothetical protein
VYLGPQAERGWLYDEAAGVQRLDDGFGPELLLRSAAWLTFKESRASFAVEHEGWVEMPDADRIIRSLHQSGWVVSGKLRQALPAICEAGGAFYGVQGHWWRRFAL